MVVGGRVVLGAAEVVVMAWKQSKIECLVALASGGATWIYRQGGPLLNHSSIDLITELY